MRWCSPACLPLLVTLSLGCGTQRDANTRDDPAPAALESFSTVGVVLYLPDEVMSERIRDSDEFIDWLGDVKETLTAHFPAASTPHEFNLVAAVKPDRKSRFWFMQEPEVELDTSDRRRRLQALRPPAVDHGPIAVAIIGSVLGSETILDSGEFSPPLPREWRETAEGIDGRVLIPDGILEVLWPD